MPVVFPPTRVGPGWACTPATHLGQNAHPLWSGRILGAWVGKGLESRAHTLSAAGTWKAGGRGTGLEALPPEGPAQRQGTVGFALPTTGHLTDGQLAPDWPQIIVFGPLC